MILTKKPSETELEYLWYIGKAKESGEIPLTWEQLTPVLNREARPDDEHWTESAWRKKYAMGKAWYDQVFSKMSMVNQDKVMREQADELYKLKKQISDQRREYNKILTHEARSEHLIEEMTQAANRLNNSYPLLTTTNITRPNIQKEALLCLSDWHYGMVTDNIWNTYNTKICIERAARLVAYVEEYLKLNQIDILHIVLLGDAAHGSIHTTCRILSEEKTCDQIMHVSELYAQVINELSKSVNYVDVHSCYGNHLRTIQDKKDNVDADNMETLIPWWLKQRLQNNHKIEILDSEYKEFIQLDILGNHICCVHGNLDKFKELGVTVNTIFTRKFGKSIDYTISGDKHHLEEFEQFDIESILVRSMCGTDDHANNNRLYSKPGQTLIIFNNEYGRESTYHISLK